MKINEKSIQLLIIFMGITLVGFSFYYIFAIAPSSKTIQSKEECMAEANLAVMNRVNHLCSKKFQEKMLCYLQDSFKNCAVKYPNTSSGGSCKLSDEVMNAERQRHSRQLGICNEIFGL